MSAKTTYWAQIGRTDEQVQKALKLTKMSESAQQKYYQKFLYKAEGVKMSDLVYNGITPTQYLKRLGLPLSNSDAKTKYYRFLKKYDDFVYKTGAKAPLPTRQDEMNLLLRVWIDKGRSERYVFERLGVLDDIDARTSNARSKTQTYHPTEKDIKRNPAYKHLEKYHEYRRNWRSSFELLATGKKHDAS